MAEDNPEEMTQIDTNKLKQTDTNGAPSNIEEYTNLINNLIYLGEKQTGKAYFQYTTNN